jgi:hypothetical protein
MAKSELRARQTFMSNPSVLEMAGEAWFHGPLDRIDRLTSRKNNSGTLM